MILELRILFELYILGLLFLVIIYFAKDSYEDYISFKDSYNDRIRRLHFASFIASTLVLISGVIFLYIVIVIVDENLDVEIAFN